MGGLVLFKNGFDLQIVEPRVGLLFPLRGIARAQISATELVLLFVGQAGCPVEEAVLLIGAAGATDLLLQTLVDIGWQASPFALIRGVAAADFFDGEGCSASALALVPLSP